MVSKVATTILIFRVIQFVLGIAFLVFWTWSLAAGFVVSGGPGEYFFGYVSAILTLATCVHGFRSFAKRQHLVEHRALYHNARWAVDLGFVCLWVGVILIEILVPASEPDRNLFGSGFVVGMGVSITQLFEGITFMLTALLLIIPAVKARRSKKGEERRKDVIQEIGVESGLQATQPLYAPPTYHDEIHPVGRE